MNGGGVFLNPELYRVALLKQALKAHVISGGKMRINRSATPSRVLELVGQLTGKQYKRGQQVQALEDLESFISSIGGGANG